jgi:penicillin amidase
LDLLTNWDGNLSRYSAAGALYAVWLQEIVGTFHDQLKLDKESTATLKSLNGISVILTALENPSAPWFADPLKENRDQFLLKTFAAAVRKAQDLVGPDERSWRWGKLHTVTFHHPLEKLSPAHAKAFNLGPVERPGDMNTPNNTRHNEKFEQIHGASYRQLFDLADWDKGLATSTPGQSGQPGSPHYDDLLPLWAEAQYFPLAYSRKRVDEVTAHRLTLTPR